jgi:hypothetical protein
MNSEAMAMVQFLKSKCPSHRRSVTLGVGIAVVTGVVLLAPWSAMAENLSFSSGDRRVALYELFTSEGCSSCPPAEAWLARLKQDPRLWKEIVPLAFHVDYWDHLGWKDRFANKEYAARQYRYHQKGNINTVYTPGFVVNGREWRGWFRGRHPDTAAVPAGNLSVNLQGKWVTAQYQRTDSSQQLLVLNLALLGAGLQSDIAGGENRGRTLKQEFVVLRHIAVQSLDMHWQLPLPSAEEVNAEQLALAVWVSRVGDQAPLQATGGWISSATK